MGIRHRCLPVGCPKETRPTLLPKRKPEWGERIVSVFENLHRKRFDDSYRSQFAEHLEVAACRFPNLTFLLKPHHNQRWSAIHWPRRFSHFPNIRLLDPLDPEWEPYAAQAIIAISDAVITTPSTVALDASRAACPVGVVNQ